MEDQKQVKLDTLQTERLIYSLSMTKKDYSDSIHLVSIYKNSVKHQTINTVSVSERKTHCDSNASQFMRRRLYERLV